MKTESTELLLRILNTPTGDALKVEVINKLIPEAKLAPRKDPLARGVIESAFAAAQNHENKTTHRPDPYVQKTVKYETKPPKEAHPPKKPIGKKIMNKGFLDITPEDVIKPKTKYPAPDKDPKENRNRVRVAKPPIVKGIEKERGKFDVDGMLFVSFERAAVGAGLSESSFRTFLSTKGRNLRRVRLEGHGIKVFYSLEDLREARS